MTELLLALGKVNLAAAAAIIAVILIRKPVRQVFGARQAYGVWLLVPLAALAVLIPAHRTVVMLTAVAPQPLSVNAAALPAEMPTDPSFYLAAAPPPSLTVDPSLVGACLWLAGMALMAAWLLRKQLEFTAEERLGRAGPAVVGLMRPRIVTPANFTEMFNDRERQVILAHESTHIARQDARANGFVALIRCVCWFNPLIHVGAHLMRIDQELACDAQVIERHPNSRRTYAEAMLKAELSGAPLPLGCYWPTGASHPLTERVALLKRAIPGRARRIAGMITLAALATGAGLAAWAAQPARIAYEEQPPVAAPTEQPREASPTAPAATDRAVPVPAPPAKAISPAEKPTVIPATPERIYAPLEAPLDKNGIKVFVPVYLQSLNVVDPAAPVSITGTISDVKWVNPSTQIYVRDSGGKDWLIQTGTPNSLLRTGFTKENLKAGVAITAYAHQRRDRACASACMVFAAPDKLQIEGLSQPQDAPAPEKPQPAPIKDSADGFAPVSDAPGFVMLDGRRDVAQPAPAPIIADLAGQIAIQGATVRAQASRVDIAQLNADQAASVAARTTKTFNAGVGGVTRADVDDAGAAARRAQLELQLQEAQLDVEKARLDALNATAHRP